jgi:hypothetical protein
MTKIIQVLAITIMMMAASAWAQTSGTAASTAGGATMPQDWDSRIPLPKGATLVGSSTPREGSKNIVYSADFSAPGSYEELVKFYETALPKAGFKIGPKIQIPARKVYNRSFTWTDILDTVEITPSSSDPSKMNIHIAYTPPPKANEKKQ